jgi:hypothetical protein
MGGPDAQSVEPLNLSLYKASFDKLQKQVCDVLIEVEHQKQTIKDLSSRLSTVVSVIEGGSVAELTAAAVNDFAAAIKRPAAVVAADHAVQHSVVAAMYVDNQRRQNRATNFILSGLPVSNTRPDQNAVADLCRREFREDPDIVHCKRLGKLSPNRIQPLLVVLKTAAQAVRFISLAKKLRQSTDPVTKNGIYIAANLTKAEAQAAYVVRCERRQAAARKQQRLQQQQHQPPAVHGTSATVTVRSGSPPVQNRPSPPTTQNSLSTGQQRSPVPVQLPAAPRQPTAPVAGGVPNCWQPMFVVQANQSETLNRPMQMSFEQQFQHQSSQPSAGGAAQFASQRQQQQQVANIITQQQFCQQQPPELHRLTAQQSSPPRFHHQQTWQHPQQPLQQQSQSSSASPHMVVLAATQPTLPAPSSQVSSFLYDPLQQQMTSLPYYNVPGSSEPSSQQLPCTSAPEIIAVPSYTMLYPGQQLPSCPPAPAAGSGGPFVGEGQ